MQALQALGYGSLGSLASGFAWPAGGAVPTALADIIASLCAMFALSEGVP